MTKLTPQEKKALSYAKDRRNTLHENDKASRRLIPLGKARANRAYRKKVEDVLREAVKVNDPEQLELIGSKIVSVPMIEWEKYPDTPLREVVESKLERRIDHAGNGKTARKRIRKFAANLKITVEQEIDGRWKAEANEVVTVSVYAETREKAIEQCTHVAGLYYMEEIGAGKILKEYDDGMISITTY